MPYPALLQVRQVLQLNEKANGSRLAWGSFDQAVAFQDFDHIVNRGRRDSKVALQIGFRRSLAVDFGVVVDECQVLALFFRERRRN